MQLEQRQRLFVQRRISSCQHTRLFPVDFPSTQKHAHGAEGTNAIPGSMIQDKKHTKPYALIKQSSDENPNSSKNIHSDCPARSSDSKT